MKAVLRQDTGITPVTTQARDSPIFLCISTVIRSRPRYSQGGDSHDLARAWQN
jgi:hypothetical protein